MIFYDFEYFIHCLFFSKLKDVNKEIPGAENPDAFNASQKKMCRHLSG
ncbi:hypothetical protein [Morganella morganii IS15]|nr:hypothetical protein CSB69_0497 [Morganella morganii]CDK63082.1 hypothetical protein [Morganella morganii IS15]